MGLQPILYGWWLCGFTANFIWLVTVLVYSQFYMVGDSTGLEPILYGWWLCRFIASFIWLVTVQVYSQFYMVGDCAGLQLWESKPHSMSVRAITYSNDSAHILSGSDDTKVHVRLWHQNWSLSVCVCVFFLGGGGGSLLVLLFPKWGIWVALTG